MSDTEQRAPLRASPARNAALLQRHEKAMVEKINAGLKLLAHRLAQRIIAERDR
jgi:hypothetical protein